MRAEPSSELQFEKRHLKKGYQNILEKRTREYRDLVNKWIVGQTKNNRYVENVDGGTIQKGDAEYYALIDWTLPSVSYKYKEINFVKMCEPDPEYRTRRSSFIPVTKIAGKLNWLLGSFHDYAQTTQQQKTKDEKRGNEEDRDTKRIKSEKSGVYISPGRRNQQKLQQQKTSQNQTQKYADLLELKGGVLPILMDFAGTCEKADNNDKCPALACAFREMGEESRGLLEPYVREAMETPSNVAIFEGVDEIRKEKVYFIFISLDYEKVKDLPEKFNEQGKVKPWDRTEKLGPLAFYPQRKIHAYQYRTSKNLTDFISFLLKK